MEDDGVMEERGRNRRDGSEGWVRRGEGWKEVL